MSGVLLGNILIGVDYNYGNDIYYLLSVCYVGGRIRGV